jgi:polar amino acid transport system ATP-binding protein
MIRVEQLHKTFGALHVLNGVNAEIHKGDVVAIIGPSGCGKSTFLRCLNLLEKPDSGHLFVDEADILAPGTRVDTVRQKMNMVFQSFNLFSHLTVLENLTVAPVKLKGLNVSEAERKALELLKLVGLAEKANHFPDELSGGQKQRVAIARCLAMEPEVILFDEPTSALDPTMVREVQSVIRRLAKEGMTMLIVTHEMDFARDVSNRVFYMDTGGIYEDGSPEQIFGNPQKPKTRAFINRTRCVEFEIRSDDFDFYGMNAQIDAFCEKQALPKRIRQNLLLLVEEVIQAYQPSALQGALELTVEYSERTDQLSLICTRQGSLGNPLEGDHLPDDIGVLLIRSLAETIEFTAEGENGRLALTVRAGALSRETR